MFYEIAIRAVNLLWHFWFRLEINGRENEPQSGGYILASNHCSATMIVCQGIRKHHIHFMAKAELFEIPVFKARHPLAQGISGIPRHRRHHRD